MWERIVGHFSSFFFLCLCYFNRVLLSWIWCKRKKGGSWRGQGHKQRRESVKPWREKARRPLFMSSSHWNLRAHTIHEAFPWRGIAWRHTRWAIYEGSVWKSAHMRVLNARILSDKDIVSTSPTTSNLAWFKAPTSHTQVDPYVHLYNIAKTLLIRFDAIEPLLRTHSMNYVHVQPNGVYFGWTYSFNTSSSWC